MFNPNNITKSEPFIYWTSPNNAALIKIDPFICDKIRQLAQVIRQCPNNDDAANAMNQCKERIFTVENLGRLLQCVHAFDQAFPDIEKTDSEKKTLIFDNGEKRPLSALEVKFLVTISEYFKSLFSERYKEAKQTDLSLINVQKNTFDTLMLTLENGKIDNARQAFDILALSAYLMMRHSPAETYFQNMWSFDDEKTSKMILEFCNHPEIQSFPDPVRSHLAEFLIFSIDQACKRRTDPKSYLQALKNLDPKKICFTLGVCDEAFKIVLD